MAQSVKLADDIMSIIRRESGLQSRSVAGQITHWVNIGRAIEKSETFDYSHIAAALAGEMSPDNLTAEEQEVWFAQLGDELTQPGASEIAFHEDRKRLGRGVGLNEHGELVRQEQAAR